MKRSPDTEMLECEGWMIRLRKRKLVCQSFVGSWIMGEA
jgi:hypothetical protein